MKQDQETGAGWGQRGGPGEKVPGREQETVWLTDSSVRKTEKSSKQSAEGQGLGNISAETQSWAPKHCWSWVRAAHNQGDRVLARLLGEGCVPSTGLLD